MPTTSLRISSFAAAPSAQVIACEQTGRWAVALRRELAATGLRVRETRTLDDAAALLLRWPASLLVLELTSGNARPLIDRLATWTRSFPLARAVVVANRELADYEGLLREAGAVHFLVSTRGVGPVSSLIRRHLERAPAGEQLLTERIWNALPWNRED